jgi:hypothetical protein
MRQCFGHTKSLEAVKRIEKWALMRKAIIIIGMTEKFGISG